MDYPSDCLVFKIQENDINQAHKIFDENKTSNIDTTLYILYDKREKQFILRGKRTSFGNKKSGSKDFSFSCKRSKDLALFLSFIICPFNTINIILYNNKDLPSDSNEITYELLDNVSDRKSNEIAGYDNEKFSKRTIISILKMLKNVFNYY